VIQKRQRGRNGDGEDYGQKDDVFKETDTSKVTVIHRETLSKLRHRPVRQFELQERPAILNQPRGFHTAVRLKENSNKRNFRIQPKARKSKGFVDL
jgi:hypothetical protein